MTADGSAHGGTLDGTFVCGPGALHDVVRWFVPAGRTDPVR